MLQGKADSVRHPICQGGDVDSIRNGAKHLRRTVARRLGTQASVILHRSSPFASKSRRRLPHQQIAQPHLLPPPQCLARCCEYTHNLGYDTSLHMSFEADGVALLPTPRASLLSSKVPKAHARVRVHTRIVDPSTQSLQHLAVYTQSSLSARP